MIQAVGKIVVGGNIVRSGSLGPGQTDGDYMLARFLPGGPLDTSFGVSGTGWVDTDMGGIDVAGGMVSTADGGIIQGGLSTTGPLGGTRTTTDAFAAYLAGGVVDTRFGGGSGRAIETFGRDTALAYGPGRRFVAAGVSGNRMHAARFFDAGANLVAVATLDAVADEAGPTPASFFVFRSERLPTPTRVYFTCSGTAVSPVSSRVPRLPVDYTGVVAPPPGPVLYFDTGFVDIPANQTFTVLTITPVNDTRAEGNETAVFTVQADPNYDVGDPASVTITIVDDDAPPPTVQQVYVRGSTWRGDDGDPSTTTFGEALSAGGFGDADLGVRADDLPADATLQWINMDQVVLRYTSPPTGAGVPTAAGVTLHGLRSDYSVGSVGQTDPDTFVLTLDRPLGSFPAAAGGGNDGDRVTLTVPGGGAGGASYSLALFPLQGDADRAGGRVNAVDLGFVKARANRTANDPPGTGAQYIPFADANADGRINAIDLGAVKARLNDALPAALAETPMSASAALATLRDDSVVAKILDGRVGELAALGPVSPPSKASPSCVCSAAVDRPRSKSTEGG
jgi:hypothetical protein